MAELGKGNAVEQDGMDRISSIPRNVIDRIIERITIQDAIRTSILSRTWRYIWADHPCLLFDKRFCFRIIMLNRRMDMPENCDFTNVVSGILLQHHGPILKFVLDISKLRPAPRYYDTDRWLIFLSKKGVRELTLDNSNQNCYRVHSCIFSFPDLTELCITNFVLKPPNIVQFLRKLTKLYLEKVTLGQLDFSTPLLVSLKLSNCLGIRDIKISAPILESLSLIDNDGLELRHYMICKNIVAVALMSNIVVEHTGQGERIDLAKLLCCWPRLSELLLDGCSLKFLAAGEVSVKLPFNLNHLRLLVLPRITFDLDQIGCILCLLRSCLILHNLKISASNLLVNIGTEAEALNYKEVVGRNPKLDQLRTVKMRHFKGSGAELFFVELLLGNSPSLESMFVEEDQTLDLNERLRISKELMRLRRASTQAEIIFQPNIPVSREL